MKTETGSVPTTEDNPFQIYVRGLPYQTGMDEVQEFFGECGTGPTEVDLPLSSDGRSSGTAILTFTCQADCDTAISYDKADFGGRWLSITPFKSITHAPSEKQPGTTSVFVGNLSWDIDEDTLKAHFESCGNIKGVRFATDRETGDFKGFGHVEFYETEATYNAVELPGSDLMGRALRVDFAKQRQDNGGGRGGGGRGGRDGGRGRGGGRGGGGRGGRDGGRGRGGGRGGGRGTPDARSKNSGGIADFKGTKISFD